MTANATIIGCGGGGEGLWISVGARTCRGRSGEHVESALETLGSSVAGVVVAEAALFC